MSEPTLSVQSISKRYGTVQALDRVSAEFRAGEVHALLGENGAGKSTLMEIMAGFVPPDSGQILLHGSPLNLSEPRSAGIEMVHQHFMLVPEFSVAENLALAELGSLRGLIDPVGASTAAVAKAKELGWTIDLGTKTGQLPVGAQQRIEILKALAGDSPILIFDEPTATLSPDEVQDLMRVLRVLKSEGKTVILIAHKLSEVFEIADRVTVLRRGKFIASSMIEDVDQATLAKWMVGELPPGLSHSTVDVGPISLSAKNLWVKGNRGEDAVRGANLEVRAGELLGIGGVDGNGQVELAEALAGVRRFHRGTIDYPGGKSKTGYIPQDRQSDGLTLDMSLSDNLLLGGLENPKLRSGPFLKPKAIREWAEGLVERYRIKIGSLSDPASSLSGGNQQKIVVSRTLASSPDLLIAVNPTRGLDIQATQFVHEQLVSAANGGAAVALFSTDLDELAAVATRTVFMSRGEISNEVSASALVGGT